jgi:HAD superfamily hydrolase (TIGR01509 family)
LTKLGYPITGEEYSSRFAGQMLDQILHAIDRETGENFHERFPLGKHREEMLSTLAAEVKAIDGVKDILEKLVVKSCIASGSSVRRNEVSLKSSGLFEFFKDKIFSSTEVKQGKPAPDIFLYTAEKMGAVPARTLVIEDSVHGVTAARAAGMTVFAFMGGSHITLAWKERIQKLEPDIMFDDMRELPALMARYGEAAHE